MNHGSSAIEKQFSIETQEFHHNLPLDAEATANIHFVFSDRVDLLAAGARETAKHAFQEDASENNIAPNDWHVEALGEQPLRDYIYVEPYVV